jgi:hypothetical protein
MIYSIFLSHDVLQQPFTLLEIHSLLPFTLLSSSDVVRRHATTCGNRNRNDGYMHILNPHLSYITSCLSLHSSKRGASATSADKLILSVHKNKKPPLSGSLLLS